MKKLFLPDTDMVSFLTGMGGGKVYCPLGDSMWAGIVVLESKAGHRIGLSSDYASVEFKFEVFFISPVHIDVPDKLPLRHIITLPEKAHIDLLFQAAWLRSARKDEVPSGYEEIVEEVGAIKSAPESASAIGVYLKGVSFLDGIEPLMVISISDNDPNLMAVSVGQRKKLQDFIRQVDYVNLSDLGVWEADMLGAGWTQAEY